MEAQAVIEKEGRLVKIGVFIGGVLLLIGTWYFLFMYVAAMTEGWLVPWDCWPASERPPLGTWARTVNDFFEIPPGSILPGVVVVTISAGIFLSRTSRATKRTLLPLAFATTNLLLLVVDVFLVAVAHQLPDLWRAPNDIGYHQTWPSILVTTILLSALFVVQLKIDIERSQNIG